MNKRPSQLGELPTDWARKKLGAITKVRQGLQIAISDRLTAPTSESKEYITIQSINKKDQAREYIHAPSKRVICNQDDVLMTRTGNTGIVVTGVDGVFHNNFFLIDFDRELIDGSYLVEYLRTRRVQYLILTKAGTSTIPDLNHKDFYSIEFPVPPFLEQKKIAQILSTWDIAIATTEKLLENSKKQKQALMQQLLTGKKRFPGFNEKWSTKRLGQIGEIKSAGVDKNILEGEKPVRLLNFTDVFNRSFIYSKELNHWVTAPDAKVLSCNVKKGDVFFTPSSETRDEVGIPAVAAEDINDCCYSYHVVRFRLHENWDLNFKAYIFTTPEFRKQAYMLADGSGQRYVISQDGFRSIKITYPTYQEQVLIGKVIKAAEDEVNSLKQKITYLNEEKKALIQQLLTGKRRVRVN